MESSEKKVERENCKNAKKKVMMQRTKLKLRWKKKEHERGMRR